MSAEVYYYSGQEIKQVLDDEGVEIESVYSSLTIVKQKPREVNLRGETILFTTKLHSSERSLTEIGIAPVVFTEDLMNYNACCIANLVAMRTTSN